MPVAFGEEDVRDTAEQAERHQLEELGQCRRVPGERQRQCAGQRGDQREIKHDRRRGFALRQPAGLDDGAGIAERGEQREGRPGRGGGGADRGVMADIEVRDQHHDDADETDRDRGPAEHAHLLLEDDGGERHRDQRRREGDGGGVGERQPGQRSEVREHAADAQHAAAEMAEGPAGVERAHQFAAQGVDQQHRGNGAGRAEEHHLSDRRDIAQLPHQRRHQREQERGQELQADGFVEIH